MVTSPGAYQADPTPAPATDLEFITASDTADVPREVTRGLLVGTAGNARLILACGKDTGATNLVPLQQGWNPVGVRRVYLTGLTASNIWGAY